MKLSDALKSLSRDQTVDVFDSMLGKDRARVSISWRGRKNISVKGYSGTVPFKAIVLKFLLSSEFQLDEFSSPEQKIKCYDLWKSKICPLSRECTSKLKSAWFSKYFAFNRIQFSITVPKPSFIDLTENPSLRFKVQKRSL